MVVRNMVNQQDWLGELRPSQSFLPTLSLFKCKFNLYNIDGKSGVFQRSK